MTAETSTALTYAQHRLGTIGADVSALGVICYPGIPDDQVANLIAQITYQRDRLTSLLPHLDRLRQTGAQ